MNRRLVFIPLCILFAGAGFVIVSLLILCTRARINVFITWKLRLGGALLVLFAFLGNGCSKDVFIGGCYALPMIDRAEVTSHSTSEVDSYNVQNLTLWGCSLTSSPVVGGIITHRFSDDFSYWITDLSADTMSEVLIKDRLPALDGTYDEETEEFVFVITDLTPDTYMLRFIPKALEEVTVQDFEDNTLYNNYHMEVIP